MNYRALIVDDDDEVAFGLCKVLKTFGFKARHARSAGQALQRHLREETFHLAICDWHFSEEPGLRLIEQLHESCPATYIVMLTAYGVPMLVRAAFKRGAADYFAKPLRNHQLERLCQKVMASAPIYLPNKLLIKPRRAVEFEGMLSREESMLTIFDSVRDAAALRSVAYLIGEHGVGKSALARAIHNRSSVADKPFLTLQTDGRSGPQLERMLFGCERAEGTDGAHTGLIAQASGGTLYIENVAGLDTSTQAQLLEYIKLGQYRHVDSVAYQYSSTRILASQTGNVAQLSAGIGLYPGLEYALHGCMLRVPALRERRRDIPLLSNQLMERLRASGGCKIERLSPDAERQLSSYDWPGNLPELENAIRCSTYGTRSSTLQVGHLPPQVRQTTPLLPMLAVPFGAKLAHVERELILQTLELTRGNRSLAAEMLGISRGALRLKLEQYEREQLALGPESPMNQDDDDSAPDSIILKPKRR